VFARFASFALDSSVLLAFKVLFGRVFSISIFSICFGWLFLALDIFRVRSVRFGL